MIRKYLVLILCIYLGDKLYSQSKIEYYIDFAPNYAFRTYTLDDHSNDTLPYRDGEMIFKNFKNHYTSLEKPSIGFGINAGIGYHINDHINLQLGLGYKFLSIKIIETIPIDRFPYGDSLVPNYPSNISETFHHYYQYISLPIEFQYYPWIKKKLKLGFMLGTSIDLFVNKGYRNNKISDQEDYKYEYGDISRICPSLRGGIQFCYDISKNFKAIISPEYARYILPNVKYNLQLFDGIYCKINQYYYYGQINFKLIYSK